MATRTRSPRSSRPLRDGGRLCPTTCLPAGRRRFPRHSCRHEACCRGGRGRGASSDEAEPQGCMPGGRRRCPSVRSGGRTGPAPAAVWCRRPLRRGVPRWPGRRDPVRRAVRTLGGRRPTGRTLGGRTLGGRTLGGWTLGGRTLGGRRRLARKRSERRRRPYSSCSAGRPSPWQLPRQRRGGGTPSGRFPAPRRRRDARRWGPSGRRRVRRPRQRSPEALRARQPRS